MSFTPAMTSGLDGAPFHSFDALLRDLREAFDVCRALGLDARQSRFGTYARRLEDASARFQQIQLGENAELRGRDIIDYASSIVEAAEFSETLLTLRDFPPASLRLKLAKVLSGPEFPGDEEPSAGNVLRNVLFELNIAAKLKRAGFEPTLGEHPDLSAHVDGRVLCFECKRVFSESKISRRLLEAEEQLIADLRDLRYVPPTARGVVAVSLTKIINPRGGLAMFPSIRHGMEHLLSILRDLAEIHEGKMLGFRQEVIGVILHVITPAYIQEAAMCTKGEAILNLLRAADGSQDARLFRRVSSTLRADYGVPST